MNGERYLRQTTLRDFGSGAQKRLSKAKVLVVGAGGLGAPVLTYLNAMGVGTLGIVDGDIVSLSNLHRQVLFDEGDVGRSKVRSVAQKLKAQNSDTYCILHDTFLSRENALEIIAPYDVVVDASDNFATRYLVNDACVIRNKPFVYGALHGFEGQLSVFNHANGPTYRCLFPEMPGPDAVPNCDENGVLGVIPGIVGNLQALETVKVITGVGEVLSGKVLLFDGLSLNTRTVRFSKNPKNSNIKKLETCYDWDCGTVMKSISVKDFKALRKSRSVQLIDVRTSKEYEDAHLKDSLNIPLGDLEARITEIDFNDPVYVLCQSGKRSAKAIAQLQKGNPKATLINIEGGMDNRKGHATKC
ncbi:MAG: HesA/MoeB/ThiF family protein [Bacteroidota bacterium]